MHVATLAAFVPFLSVVVYAGPAPQQEPLKASASQCSFTAVEKQFCVSKATTLYVQIQSISLPSPSNAPQHQRFLSVAKQRPGNENGFVNVSKGPWEITGVGDKESDESTLKVQKGEGDEEVVFEYKDAKWSSEGEAEAGEDWCKSEEWDSDEWKCGESEEIVRPRDRLIKCAFRCGE